MSFFLSSAVDFFVPQYRVGDLLSGLCIGLVAFNSGEDGLKIRLYKRNALFSTKLFCHQFSQVQ